MCVYKTLPKAQLHVFDPIWNIRMINLFVKSVREGLKKYLHAPKIFLQFVYFFWCGLYNLIMYVSSKRDFVLFFCFKPRPKKKLLLL